MAETETPTRRTRRTKEQIAADKAEHEAQCIPVSGGRSGLGANAQTQMDETVLDAEEHMELLVNIELKQATQEAAKRNATARKEIEKILFEVMGLRDGKDHAFRLRDKRIVIIGATGEVRTIPAQDRKPITKVHITDITD